MDTGTRGASDAVRVVLVTVPDAETGRALARQVVEERLAACGNVIPGLRSVYRWAGEVKEDSEAMVLFKTTEGAIPQLEKRVLELHPYEVPEFLALPVIHGHTPYLRWVRGEVADPGISR
jgi:periplasmic divalent cation tolerance protein